MKTMHERLQQRLRKDRPMETISLRMPQDVLDDLKEIAPELGFSGYQTLLRAYVGQGLRRDQARMQESGRDAVLRAVSESLRRHGVDDQVISDAIADAQASTSN